jgi:hypothetical protein
LPPLRADLDDDVVLVDLPHQREQILAGTADAYCGHSGLRTGDHPIGHTGTAEGPRQRPNNRAPTRQHEDLVTESSEPSSGTARPSAGKPCPCTWKFLVCVVAAVTCLRRRNARLPGIICRRLKITAIRRVAEAGPVRELDVPERRFCSACCLLAGRAAIRQLGSAAGPRHDSKSGSLIWRCHMGQPRITTGIPHLALWYRGPP